MKHHCRLPPELAPTPHHHTTHWPPRCVAVAVDTLRREDGRCRRRRVVAASGKPGGGGPMAWLGCVRPGRPEAPVFRGASMPIFYVFVPTDYRSEVSH